MHNVEVLELSKTKNDNKNNNCIILSDEVDGKSKDFKNNDTKEYSKEFLNLLSNSVLLDVWMKKDGKR